MTSAEDIIRPEFDALLTQYPSLLSSITPKSDGSLSHPFAVDMSQSRLTTVDKTVTRNPEKQPLEDLDVYRYDEAPKLFAGDKPQRQLDLDAIKRLVEWKLRHGKFRPSLMNLVSSNDAETASETVRAAFATYQKDPSNLSAALDILCQLRGIGPATASLLLSVYSPSQVIFFSDEAFYWLCNNGERGPIKYNSKEYKALSAKATSLAERLGVAATDIEKVAYVVMKQPRTVRSQKSDKTLTKPDLAEKKPVKRKAAPKAEPSSEGQTIRRSKRTIAGPTG
ncbi:hypothetical protein S40288_02216 [Stachybotrys chartarum IBT 40288]|nr:hypothetical protein S40288_02216 [Stachybotrys chartarum IBT 40288]